MYKYNTKIVCGRLYNFRGTIVRAGRITNNKMRHIKVHNLLHGFVKEDELEVIDKDSVAKYLLNV